MFDCVIEIQHLDIGFSSLESPEPNFYFSLVAFILGGSDNLNTESFWFPQGTKKHQLCERSAGVAYGVVISLFHSLIFTPGTAGNASSTIKTSS